MAAMTPGVRVALAVCAASIAFAVIHLRAAPPAHPDLTGVWANTILTPLERPKALGDRAFFTEAEVKEFENPERTFERWKAVRDPAERQISTEIVSPFADTARRTVGADRRASLIVDPADGRLPARTPEAQRRAAEGTAARPYRPYENPEELLPSDRCLIWGAGPPLFPLSNNGFIQIVQTSDAVLILLESMHDARIVPLDGRPHLPPHVRQWKGDSRGRWEGAALVVETTNLTDKTTIEGSGPGLRVTERFSRPARDTLRYEATVIDPDSFAQPWTVAWTMARTDERIFEYACHEANYSMENTLRGARAQDRPR